MIKRREKIDTLIVSDLHLGARLNRPRKFLKTILKLNFKRIILNGDIFDSLDLQRLNHKDWAVLSELRELSKKVEVIWIVGNHDGSAVFLGNLLGVRVYNKYIWEEKGKKFLAIHGHQFDRFLHKNIIISRVAILFYAMIRKIFGEKNTLINWAKNSKRWLRMSAEVEKEALIYAKFKKVDYIFCGHTHIARIGERWGIKYYNSGSWVTPPFGYIIIKNGEVSLREVN